MEDTFAAAVNCMDGRAQEPVRRWLRDRCGVLHVDQITEAGPVRILADLPDDPRLDSLKFRVGISVERHHARAVALVAHHDCAGNPVDRAEQERQIRAGVMTLKSWAPDVPVFGLWVNSEWRVEPVCEA